MFGALVVIIDLEKIFMAGTTEAFLQVASPRNDVPRTIRVRLSRRSMDVEQKDE